MLRLRIANSQVPPIPSSAEVWRDNQGAVCAYGQILGEEYWMHLPGLASFRFSDRGDEIAAAVRPAVREELVRDAYRRSVLPMALQVCGREVLHASAVCTPAGVLALCAISETGKSTIAFGLSRRGYPLWADDAVAFDVSPSGALAISLPFNIRLRPSAAALFEVDSSRVPQAELDDVRLGAETAPLLAVCVLRRSDSAAPPVAVGRLSSAAAFAAVLAHAYCFTLQDGKRKRRMIWNYLDLVGKIPIFDICFQPGLENLPAILDTIEGVLEENSAVV